MLLKILIFARIETNIYPKSFHTLHNIPTHKIFTQFFQVNFPHIIRFRCQVFFDKFLFKAHFCLCNWQINDLSFWRPEVLLKKEFHQIRINWSSPGQSGWGGEFGPQLNYHTNPWQKQVNCPSFLPTKWLVDFGGRGGVSTGHPSQLPSP